jgi:NADPH-dependent F420 reductase
VGKDGDEMADVAIIGGTGDQGYGLAVRWALAGRAIAIGSRDGGRAQNAAERLRDVITASGSEVPPIVGLENTAAAAEAPVVVIAVPLAAQIATIKSIHDHLRTGAILIDVTVPLATAIGGRASRMLGIPAGSAAEQLAEYAPDHAQVVAAFHFLSADLLSDPTLPLESDVIGCGGDGRAQAVLRELAESIEGVRYAHAGPLAAARLIEAAATMLIAINVRHKVRHSGMRITGLFH